MSDKFILQDLYVEKEKNIVRTAVKSLTCHLCKKELNGISIAGKLINGKMVFLCSHHYTSKPYQIVSVS